MSSSSDVLETKTESPEQHTREDNEYARLVIPSNTRAVDVNDVHPIQKSKYKFFVWLMKVLVGSLLLIILSLIFLRWGVPFAFEKVWGWFSLLDKFLSFVNLDCCTYKQVSSLIVGLDLDFLLDTYLLI